MPIIPFPPYPSTYIDSGTGRIGNISANGEIDRYSVTMIGGLDYVINVVGYTSIFIPGASPLNDPEISLEKWNWFPLPGGWDTVGTDDDGGAGLNSRLAYTPTSTGTYRLNVFEHNNDATGLYRASLSVGFGRSLGESIEGTSRNDMVDGRGGNDTIYGMDGDDRLWGNSGNDLLGGATGRDQLRGGYGNDTLLGATDNDILRGGSGDDRIVGGGGVDNLAGGTGADTFVFEAWQHSTSGAQDKIMAAEGAVAFEGAGVQGGDVIDISTIDADLTTPGNQAFSFGGIGKGQLRVVDYGAWSLVQGNIDNDGAAEVAILIGDDGVAAAAYNQNDFIL
ncbi:calcium-binding protein [Paracoccus pacificus]|uniref:Calcium-binding protein n=1 Tax=Paracoccus pacificus TaxID=1463598 RepID=A0ABW4R6K0_9RHOB